MIGVSVPAALLCAVLGAREAIEPLEEAVIVIQTRQKVEEAAEYAICEHPAKHGPCEVLDGSLQSLIDGWPISRVQGIGYLCGDVPVDCGRPLGTGSDFSCHARARYVHEAPDGSKIDAWKEFRKMLHDTKGMEPTSPTHTLLYSLHP